MASFDIVESVGHAYRFLWIERRYIARLAAVPIAVKLACYLAIEIYGYQTDIIRHALIMLPAYFLDGWLLSHIVRFALFGQRWPFRIAARPSPDQPGGYGVQMVQDRAQGLLTGTAAYVVVRFLSMGALAVAVAVMTAVSPAHAPVAGAVADAAVDASGMKAQAFLAVLAVLFGSIWGFRLFWLFIPAAANVSMRSFLRRINGYGMSFYMIGAWLIGALPLMLASVVVTSMLVVAFGPQGATAASPEVEVITIIGSTFADTLILIVTTFAIALGVRPFLADVVRIERNMQP